MTTLIPVVHIILIAAKCSEQSFNLFQALLDMPQHHCQLSSYLILRCKVIILSSYTNQFSFRGRSRIFFRRGCTRLLLYFNTNKPHSFFFCRIPVVLENHRSSQGGGGAHPLHPLPRSTPEFKLIILSFPIDDHLPLATTFLCTKGGHLQES